MKIKTLTVSEVSNYVKRTLDNDFILNNLSIKGEVSNLKYHTSGHIYFSLKDRESKLNCVMFRSKAEGIDFRLEEGMQVIVRANLSIYPQTGSLQLYCNEIKKEGIGELYEKFEKLKLKLQEEGYFDEGFKKPIPAIPNRIGVITSETGAVIQDIINVTRRRNSLVDIVLYPAAVQGEGAYKTLIEGLKYFNKNKSVDVIILGRGGGSIEELWNFNEEDLAKEIFKSKIPIISAVGHEVDFTISDFVSDLRAATPSQAAEMAVPKEIDLFNQLNSFRNSLDNIIDYKMEISKNKINYLNNILISNNPRTLINNSIIRVDMLKEKLDGKIDSILLREVEKLKRFNGVLTAYNPLNVLNKGYAIIENEKGNVLSEVELLKDSNEINIKLKDGSVKGTFTITE